MRALALLAVAALGGPTSAAEPCLAGAIAPGSRRNMTLAGTMMPLRIFHYEWDSALVSQDIYKTLVEEKLGLNVEYAGSSWNSRASMYEIAGCRLTTDEHPDCSIVRNDVHVALEAWEGGEELTIRRFQEEYPNIAPVDAGSLYHTFESIFVGNSQIESAYIEGRLPLQFYGGYDRSLYQPQVYFETINNISRGTLKALNVTRMWTRVSSNYAQVTGDKDGVKIVDGLVRADSKDENWWFAPACRAWPDTCIPLITGGDGWHHDAMMQKAAAYHMPIAIAVAANFDHYSMLPVNHAILHYWWFPDALFAHVNPTNILFPRHDPYAWSIDDMRTEASNVRTFKWAHQNLKYASWGAHEVLTSFFLTNAQIQTLMQDMKIEGKTSKEIACKWLKNNAESWHTWLPVENSCLGGTYLAKKKTETCETCIVGYFCPNLTSENQLEHLQCEPGKKCPQGSVRPISCESGTYNDVRAAGSCKPCSPGSFSPEEEAKECSKCPAGWYQDESGSTACKLCPVGTYSAEIGMNNCTRCPTVTTTLTSATITAADCVCPAGTRTSISKECVACSFWEASTDGATTCTPSTVAVAVIICAVAVVALIGVSGVMFGMYKRRLKEFDDAMCAEQAFDAINCVNELAFPLVLVHAEDFLAFGSMRAYEELRDAGAQVVLDSVDEVKRFKRANFYIFLSHQWASWSAPPDTDDHRQYHCACTAVTHVMHHFEWSRSRTYVWLDYSGIPQGHRRTQMLAINTLPVYASLANQFIILAPCVEHKNTGESLGPESYKTRVWCRAEQVSHYCRHGRSRMWLCTSPSGDATVSLEPIEEHWMAENLAIFSGQCTCCRLQHKGMHNCDKEALVKPVLGLLAEIILSKDTSPICNEIYNTLLKTEAIREDMFPKMFDFVSRGRTHKMKLSVRDDSPPTTTTTQRKKLFGNSVRWLFRVLVQEERVDIKTAMEGKDVLADMWDKNADTFKGYRKVNTQLLDSESSSGGRSARSVSQETSEVATLNFLPKKKWEDEPVAAEKDEHTPGTNKLVTSPNVLVAL